MCSITADRTGFPLVKVESSGLEVHLLPVTKVQFEVFLAESNEFGDMWYEEVLAINGRASWRGGDETEHERLFLTGILPEEARAFAEWLGSGFRLPSAEEWQTVCGRWMQTPCESKFVVRMLERASDHIRQAVNAVLSGRTSSSIAEMAHMNGGVLEWVTSKRGWRLCGQPREGFCRQLFDWQTAVTPTDPARRDEACGFRLVRPIEKARGPA